MTEDFARGALLGASVAGLGWFIITMFWVRLCKQQIGALGTALDEAQYDAKRDYANVVRAHEHHADWIEGQLKLAASKPPA